MAHILDLPDELLLEIVNISDKNLHLTCKLLHAIGFSHHHPSLNSPLRKAILGNTAARMAEQEDSIREYKQTLENLVDVEYKAVAVTCLNLNIAHFDVRRNRIPDAASLSRHISRFPHLTELTLTLGRWCANKEADTLGRSDTVRYLTLVIDVIKHKDATALARELCLRYPNLHRLDIWRYQVRFRGFSLEKQRAFMTTLERALRDKELSKQGQPLPHLKTVIWKWYDKHIDKARKVWVLCMCDELEDFMVYRRAGKKAFKRIRDIRRTIEVMVECTTSHKCQFDGEVFDALVQVNKQLDTDPFFKSQEFRQMPKSLLAIGVRHAVRDWSELGIVNLRDAILSCISFVDEMMTEMMEEEMMDMARRMDLF